MLTREKLKNAHNNVMTIMKNRIMQMTNCDRTTSNLVANEILDLDRESEQLLSNKEYITVKQQVLKIAVTAAEQIFIGSGRGTEKKEYVIKWLAEHGVKYDSSKIDEKIESAIYELKQNGLIIPSAVLDSTQE